MIRKACEQAVSSSRRSIASLSTQRPSIGPVVHRASTMAPIAIHKRWHGGPHVDADAETVHLSFLQPDETTKTVDAKVGESFLQVAHRHGIDLEGACEGVCACSTCHLIFPMDVYDELPESSEDEEDMLDMAFGLTETSRLGCQVIVSKEMDGITVEMPKATRNFYVSVLRCWLTYSFK